MKSQLNAQTAWEVFKLADEFHLEHLREVAKDTILVAPKQVLEKRPSVNETLLEEILGSDLLCLSDAELLDILLSWEDAEGCTGKMDLIKKFVCLANVSEEKIRSLPEVHEMERLRKLKRKRTSSLYTADVIAEVRRKFRDSPHFRGSVESRYLSNWVNVVYSVTSYLAGCQEYKVSIQESGLTLPAGNWLEWRLPRFVVKLMAIHFTNWVAEGVAFVLSCGNDSSKMQQVFSSKEYGNITAGQKVACTLDNLVTRFRLEVRQGNLDPATIKFEGILQEAD